MKFLLTGITIAIALLLATASSLSSMTAVLAAIRDIEDGSSAINFARNLAEFTDSDSNTVIQSDDRSIEDVSEASIAANFVFNNLFFDPSSHDNTVTQTNKQSINDIRDRSLALNEGPFLPKFEDSDFNDLVQSNDQEINDITHDSEALNIGVYRAQLSNSDNNVIDQSNKQSIEDVTQDSRTANGRVNNVDLKGEDDDGCGLVCGEGKGGSDNNKVSQSNIQNIDDISESSEAANIGLNSAELENSDDNE